MIERVFGSRAAIIVIIGLVVVATLYVTTRDSAPTNVFTLESRALERLVAFSGTLVAQQSVSLAFEASGRVTEVRVETGDRVARGQILARLDSGSIEASLDRENAALTAEEARLAATLRGSRPEEIAVLKAELERAKSTQTETEQALLSSLSSAYAVADTALHKTADQLFDNPKILPRLIFKSKNSAEESRLESTRQDLELLLGAWRKEVNDLMSSLPRSPETSSLTRLIAAVGATAPKTDIVAYAEQSRTYLLTVNTFFNDLIDYTRDIISGGAITTTTIDTYTSLLTTERATILAELGSLNTALKAYIDAGRAVALYEANLSLSEAGASSEEVAEARARVAEQRARVSELAQQLEKYIVRAPFAGVVVNRSIEPGELANPAEPVISLDGEGAIEIKARISELDVIALQKNDAAEVTFDAYQDRGAVLARVTQVDPSETEENGVRGYGVTLAFDEEPEMARAGMTVNVLIKKREREAALAAPETYIRREGARSFVQVVRDDAVTEKEVTVGIGVPGGLVELVEGVSAGDTLSPYGTR